MMYELKLPILGFESMTRIELLDIDDIFCSLRNADDPHPSFTLINPYALREYSFDIPASVQEALDIHQDSKVLVYTLVVVQNPIESSTVNFLAPMIFNTDNAQAGQLVLDATKHPTFGLAESISSYLA